MWADESVLSVIAVAIEHGCVGGRSRARARARCVGRVSVRRGGAGALLRAFRERRSQMPSRGRLRSTCCVRLHSDGTADYAQARTCAHSMPKLAGLCIRRSMLRRGAGLDAFNTGDSGRHRTDLECAS